MAESVILKPNGVSNAGCCTISLLFGAIFRELRIGGPTFGAKSEQQSAVGSDGEDRLFGHGRDIPQLRLADTQGVFLFAVIDLDLPAVEIDLQQLLEGTAQIAGKQVRWIAIVQLPALGFAIGRRRDYDETKGALLGSALPVHLGDFFIADLAALATVKDLGGFPGSALVLRTCSGVNLSSA